MVWFRQEETFERGKGQPISMAAGNWRSGTVDIWPFKRKVLQDSIADAQRVLLPDLSTLNHRKWHRSSLESFRRLTGHLLLIEPLSIYVIKCHSYLGSILTNDGRCTCQIKSRIAMAKPAFNKKKNLFTSKLDLDLRKKLVKCYIWSMALYGAETWTLRVVDQKRLGSGAGEGWRRSVGPIMWEMKKCYLESVNRGISYMK